MEKWMEKWSKLEEALDWKGYHGTVHCETPDVLRLFFVSAEGKPARA
jgi:hypothetical protein